MRDLGHPLHAEAAVPRGLRCILPIAERDGWGTHYPDACKRAIPIEGMALFTVSAERRLGGYL